MEKVSCTVVCVSFEGDKKGGWGKTIRASAEPFASARDYATFSRLITMKGGWDEA